MHVGVIGAGPAGLAAARHLSTQGFTCTVFEQAGSLGGTWVYTDNVGNDQYALPIHTALYNDLRSNLPKETMAFPDFPYQEQELSYLPAKDILEYFIQYAEHFNLKKYCKFLHHVKRVSPDQHNGWNMTVVDLPNQREITYNFNAVMIGTGLNHRPLYPELEGLDTFQGLQLHSKHYRHAEQFRDKRVLVIGLGPSGLDITFQIATVTEKVLLSHRFKHLDASLFPDNVTTKPEVAKLKGNCVEFLDGTSEEVDAICFCTGYAYHYPFLTEECDIIVDEFVFPLYKHLINIEHPTMCFLGINKFCTQFYLLDFQTRFFLKTLDRRVLLPSRDKMMSDTENDIMNRRKQGQRKKYFHKLAKISADYLNDLASMGGFDPVPPVQIKMFFDSFDHAIKDFKNFRNATYRILDSDNYELTKFSQSEKIRI